MSYQAHKRGRDVISKVETELGDVVAKISELGACRGYKGKPWPYPGGRCCLPGCEFCQLCDRRNRLQDSLLELKVWRATPDAVRASKIQLAQSAIVESATIKKLNEEIAAIEQNIIRHVVNTEGELLPKVVELPEQTKKMYELLFQYREELIKQIIKSFGIPLLLVGSK